MNQGWSLPSEKGPGFLVPTELRPDWDLIIGDSLEVLPDLLKSLGTIDMFFHDSDHSYGHMMGEFRLAFPYLAKGGCLVSDDVTLNTAFLDFSRLFKRTPQLIYHHGTGSPFGAVVK